MLLKRSIWLLPLAFLTACGAGNREMNTATTTTATPAAAPATRADSATANQSTDASDFAAKPLNSPERKIIHTADFHCSVKNVFSAITTLEKQVNALGGVVEESRMDNSDCETKTSYYTADSLRQIKTFKNTATLTLRVPAQYLDSVIYNIPGLCSFVDSRIIKQTDVTYQYLANELKNRIGDNATGPAMRKAKNGEESSMTPRCKDHHANSFLSRSIPFVTLCQYGNTNSTSKAHQQEHVLCAPQSIALCVRCGKAIAR